MNIQRLGIIFLLFCEFTNLTLNYGRYWPGSENQKGVSRSLFWAHMHLDSQLKTLDVNTYITVLDFDITLTLIGAGSTCGTQAINFQVCNSLKLNL